MAKAAKRHSSKPELSFAHKIVDGKIYVPCMYFGKYAGHGNYLAASLKMEKADLGEALHGPLLCDNSGKPIPYSRL